MFEAESRAKNLGRRPVLHNRPAVHHGHSIGKPRDNPDVVTDQQRRDSEFRLELGQQTDDLGLDRGVQPGGGLVRDEEGRLGRERHRDHGPLTHAARQAVRIIVEPQTRRIHPDPLEPVEGALLGLLRILRRGVQPDGLGDLVADGHERIERRLWILEDHGDFLPSYLSHDALDLFAPAGLILGDLHDPAVLLPQGDVMFEVMEQVSLAPVVSERDLAADHARAGVEQPHDRERRDALAAAALADHAEGLAPRDRHRHPIHRANEGPLASRVEVGAQVLDLEKRRAHYFPALPSRMPFSPSPNR